MAKVMLEHSTAIRRRIKGGIIMLFAAALMAGALGPQKVFACDVTNVDLWIGDTASEARGKNTYDVFKCPECWFGWYVQWDADPGYGDFYGEIYVDNVCVDTFSVPYSAEYWEASGTASVPSNMTFGDKSVQAWVCRVGGEWCYSNLRTLVVAEIVDVMAGAKHATETLYRANDYFDEPSERQTLTQGVTAVLSEVVTPDCLYWTPDCDEYLPTICPDDASEATFSAKNHDFYSIGAACGNSSKSMNIAIEGIDIYTYINSPEEMTETYNTFLNENFNQERETTTLPGHKQCYYVDNSDDSLTSPKSDNMFEIGWINIYSVVWGDTDATVRFNSSGIKLYDSSYNKLEFGTEYNIVDIGCGIGVEGISTGTTTLTATIETQDGYTATDQLKIKVIPLDLVAVDPAPSSDEHEICHKDKLLIRVNNNDSDNDGISDWLDDDIEGGDPDLAHIILQKPTGAVDSDIGGGSIWVWFSSNLNVFKNKYKTGGAAPYTYSLSDLPYDIYLEGASASSDFLDTSVNSEIYLDSMVRCHDEIRYTVIKVDIVSPKGSLDAVKNPEASWLSSPCYHFDFQGVISTAEGSYDLDINGDIDPAPPVGYQWTLDAAAGTLTDDTTATPDHTAPATEGQGMLTLKAMIDTTDTGLKDERKVKIYKDHLARDYENFGTGGSCDYGWKVTTFNVDPQPSMTKWNCHGSTNHAYDGSGNGSSSGLSSEITSWDKDTFNAPINWSNVQAVLDRGDVVAYYAGSSLEHSATCINSTITWGANNEPVSGQETWKWYLATPQDWWNNAGTNNPPLPDCTKIIVYNKP